MTGDVSIGSTPFTVAVACSAGGGEVDFGKEPEPVVVSDGNVTSPSERSRKGIRSTRMAPSPSLSPGITEQQRHERSCVALAPDAG